MEASAARRADLVFEGGGVKGIGLAGAFLELDAQGYEPQCVAGTSAGAITAALVAVGYTGPELEQIVLHDMDFKQFADRSFLERLVPGVGEVEEFFRTRGLHSGHYFVQWMTERLEAKKITTFGQLRDDTATTDARRYKLQVIASDLTAKSMLVLPRDAGQLGIEPDELEIAHAVRMSMSIPIFFEPVVEDGHVIVDGGLLSNFPIWLFDCQGRAPEFPTFGMMLVAPAQSDPVVPRPGAPEPDAEAIGSEIDFIKAIGETMMEAHDRMYIDQANYARTIPIPTLGVKTTEFGIPPEQAQKLFDSGRDAARSFLGSWDFDAYIARFRSNGGGESRRTAVTGKPGTSTPA